MPPDEDIRFGWSATASSWFQAHRLERILGAIVPPFDWVPSSHHLARCHRPTIWMGPIVTLVSFPWIKNYFFVLASIMLIVQQTFTHSWGFELNLLQFLVSYFIGYLLGLMPIMQYNNVKASTYLPKQINRWAIWSFSLVACWHASHRGLRFGGRAKVCPLFQCLV